MVTEHDKKVHFNKSDLIDPVSPSPFWTQRDIRMTNPEIQIIGENTRMGNNVQAGELYRLDHEDLINLICGIDAGYASSFLYRMNMGELITHFGGFREYYKWNREAVGKLSEMEIYSLYLSLKAL